jgi:hypothetical protein
VDATQILILRAFRIHLVCPLAGECRELRVLVVVLYNSGVSIDGRVPMTTEVVDDDVAAILRRKSGTEKIRMVAGGWALLRVMHASQVRRDHPDWDEELVRAETSRRMAHGST